MGNNTITSKKLTHTLESKENENSTLECKENYKILRISEVKNVNKRKNRLTPAKLESRKQDKKVLASRVGLGWEVSNEHQGRATFYLTTSLP